MSSQIETLVSFFGSRTELAKVMSVTPQAIHKWERHKIPSDRAIQIEQITKGKITVKDLRPDLFQLEQQTTAA